MAVQEIKLYQVGTFVAGNRLLDLEQRSVQARMDRSNSITSGHRACQGCSEVLGAVVDTFVDLAGAADGVTATSMFDEVAHTLRATDLVTPMSYLTRVLGGGEAQSPVQAMFLVRAFTEVSERLSVEIAKRHPDIDLLDIQILVGSLMSGVVVLHRRWFALTAGVDDEKSQAVWSALLDRLLTTFRTGFGSDASSFPVG